ncbi:hypothetical protein HY948_02210 [Candidatus Gottesmanbacteria bacterium]|nr:hypothetical protein [Candidatus Gottesmanbacteria bacterium]
MGLKIETLSGDLIGEIGGGGSEGSLPAEGGTVIYYPAYQSPLAKFVKGNEQDVKPMMFPGDVTTLTAAGTTVQVTRTAETA